MNTKQIIQEMEKEFDEKFVLDPTEVFFGKREKLREQGWEVGNNGSRILKQSLTPDQVKSFIFKDHTRKLIESLAEEIIALFALPKINDKELEQSLKDMPGVEQVIRLKVKEIISQINK